jgi:hypothetical protein
MTDSALFHPQDATTPPDRLTHVNLIWIEQRIEHWIRFGDEAEERIIDRRRRVLSFSPDSVFAFVRWVANEHGTVLSRVTILRAVTPGQLYQTVPSVRPGGEILLAIGGWPKVERVLQAIDAIEAIGINPTEVSPDHWRHLHNRLTAGQKPRPYSRLQHRAFLLRRRAAP